MVGDSTGDVKVARAYGAACVWCAWGYADAPGLAPDVVARHPADLPGAVAGLLPAR
jgi:phosphoglycolate phosphatase-like HAD superfamily hydrolase